MRGEGGAKGVGWEVALSIVALDMARAVVSDVVEEGGLKALLRGERGARG